MALARITSASEGSSYSRFVKGAAARLRASSVIKALSRAASPIASSPVLSFLLVVVVSVVVESAAADVDIFYSVAAAAAD